MVESGSKNLWVIENLCLKGLNYSISMLIISRYLSHITKTELGWDLKFTWGYPLFFIELPCFYLSKTIATSKTGYIWQKVIKDYPLTAINVPFFPELSFSWWKLRSRNLLNLILNCVKKGLVLIKCFFNSNL